MPRIKREKKTMEYPDSPSGFVTLYNYKEPFMAYTKGYGFQGVLLFDGESDKVQCHLCGGWYEALPNHIRAEHNMKADEYKEEVGLSHKTALIGEELRAKHIANGLDKRLQNLRNQKGIKRSKETIEKIRRARLENRREIQNMKGSCPEQLIDFLQKEFKEKGKNMRFSDIRFENVIVKTFGSMKEACQIAGIPYRIPGQTISNPRTITTEQIVDAFHNFFVVTGKMPRYKNLTKEWNALKRKGLDEKEIKRMAALKDGVYRKTLEKIRFSEDDLIYFLRQFEKMNGRKPSYSDSRRGLLPNLSRYSYHFGTWKKALEVAFP